MKTSLRLLPFFMLIVLLSGCKAKKTVVNGNSIEMEIRYKQALAALDGRKFIIKANEFYFPSGTTPSVKTSSGSYISMQGNQANISFKPDVFPGYPFSNLNITDNAASLTNVKSTKNGDVQFSIKIDGDQNWLRRKILLTLYKNTNECFVQVNNHADSNIVNFKGEVFLLAE